MSPKKKTTARTTKSRAPAKKTKKKAAAKPTSSVRTKKAAKKTAKKAVKKASPKKKATKKVAKKSVKKVVKKAAVKKKAATKKTVSKKAAKKVVAKKRAPAKKTSSKTLAPARPAPARAKPKKAQPQDYEKFQLILLAERRRLRGDVSMMSQEALGSAENAVDNQAPIHPAEVGSHSFEQEFTLNLLSKDGDRLELIEAALAKIAAGTYGACEECEGRIPKARLEVIPETPYCVKCASKLEE